jgi:hypothetical protein
LEKDQIRPMTPEELEAEAAYAEKAFIEYGKNSNLQKVREAFIRHRQRKAAGVIPKATVRPEPE